MTTRSEEHRHRTTARVTDLTYWEATQHPTYVLLFVLPLVVLQWSLRTWSLEDGQAMRELVVEDGMRRLIGAELTWLPAAILILSLLIWLSLTSQRVPTRLMYLPMMLGESLIVALPLLVIGSLLSMVGDTFRFRITHALTAGIYEEFAFRFLLTGGLLLLFRSAWPRPQALPVSAAIVVSALLFAALHFQPVGQWVYESRDFLRLVVAGGYLALVFVGRGLGIAVGAHIAYDFWVLSMRDNNF